MRVAWLIRGVLLGVGGYLLAQELRRNRGGHPRVRQLLDEMKAESDQVDEQIAEIDRYIRSLRSGKWETAEDEFSALIRRGKKRNEHEHE